MKDKQPKAARRAFLAGTGVVAAAGAAAALTSRGPAMPAAPRLAAAIPDVTSTDGDGYRVTEHIRKYYRTTLV
ncbi:formate dehydrogenase [Cupriavidus basilensis]